jgi:lysophospholipase L1-like esterase
MTTILCYGDSNTWGTNAAVDGRHSRHERWPGVLQANLGTDYDVIEAGLGGRTTVWEDPIEEHRNGKTHLMPTLLTHKPLDLVILMLGTNDLKSRFNVSAPDIAAGAAKLVEITQRSQCGPDGSAPQVLLISPPPLGELNPRFAPMFAGAHDKQPLLAAYYETVAQTWGCGFFYPNFMVPDPADGLHFTADAHRQLGERIAVEVRQMLA